MKGNSKLIVIFVTLIAVALTQLSCNECEDRWDQDKVPSGIQLTELVDDRMNPKNEDVATLIEQGLEDVPTCIQQFDGASFDVSIGTLKPSCLETAELRETGDGFGIPWFTPYDGEHTNAFEVGPPIPCVDISPERKCWSLTTRQDSTSNFEGTVADVKIYSRFDIPVDFRPGSEVTGEDFGEPTAGEDPPLIFVREFEMRGDGERVLFPEIEPDENGVRRCVDIFLGYFETP
jgi:hypothetical protein